MTIKDIVGKISELEAGLKSIFTANAESAQAVELKGQLASLQSTVTDKLSASVSEIEKLTAANTEAVSSLETATSAIKAQDAAINDVLSSLKLESKADATFAEKLDVLKGGVTATLAKLGVNPETVPSTQTNQTQNKTITRNEFEKLSFSARNEFVRNGGKLTE